MKFESCEWGEICNFTGYKAHLYNSELTGGANIMANEFQDDVVIA